MALSKVALRLSTIHENSCTANKVSNKGDILSPIIFNVSSPNRDSCLDQDVIACSILSSFFSFRRGAIMVILIAAGIAAQDDEPAGDAPLRMMPNKLPDPVHEGGTYLRKARKERIIYL